MPVLQAGSGTRSNRSTRVWQQIRQWGQRLAGIHTGGSASASGGGSGSGRASGQGSGRGDSIGTRAASTAGAGSHSSRSGLG